MIVLLHIHNYYATYYDNERTGKSIDQDFLLDLNLLWTLRILHLFCHLNTMCVFAYTLFLARYDVSQGVSAKPLRPLTIRQLSATKFEENLRATEPKFIFKIEGNVFETVCCFQERVERDLNRASSKATLVGCVVFAEEISGQRRYLLEDGTARIRVWQWLPKDEDGVRSSDALGGLDQ